MTSLPSRTPGKVARKFPSVLGLAPKPHNKMDTYQDPCMRYRIPIWCGAASLLSTPVFLHAGNESKRHRCTTAKEVCTGARLHVTQFRCFLLRGPHVWASATPPHRTFFSCEHGVICIALCSEVTLPRVCDTPLNPTLRKPKRVAPSCFIRLVLRRKTMLRLVTSNTCRRDEQAPTVPFP